MVLPVVMIGLSVVVAQRLVAIVGLAGPRRVSADHGPEISSCRFLDASIAPLPAVANSDLNFRIYDEGRVSHQVSMWVTRLQNETRVTVLFPDNPIARESVARYIEATKVTYARVVSGRRSHVFAHARAPFNHADLAGRRAAR
jgi:hypothetical protein